MTIKPWGDEPAIPFKVEPRTNHYHGFTKLERACIDLKVPDPSLDPKLRELILESRRLDYLKVFLHRQEFK